jgi:histidyl-tRNA synthetase
MAYAIILGDNELARDIVVVRDMANSEQTPVPMREIVAWLKERL